jgi:hypothetical protein
MQSFVSMQEIQNHPQVCLAYLTEALAAEHFPCRLADSDCFFGACYLAAIYPEEGFELRNQKGYPKIQL